MDEFKKIGVIGRLGSAKVMATFKRLKQFLQKRGSHIVLDQELASILPVQDIQIASRVMMGEICDLVIVIGGDGSLLGAARSLARFQVPVLGVNRGRLGFLTDILPSQLEAQITEVLAGRYSVESRFLLETEIRRHGQPIATSEALNDVILHSGKAMRMIEFELYIDGQFVYSQRSDGVIISTPTGSTAYALSAGGPIMHPKLDALVLVPMYPHALTTRPLVIDGNSEIKLVIGHENKTYPHISCDGQVNLATGPDDSIAIRKKKYQLQLIHPMSHNYYEICRTKLGWGNRLGE